MRTNTGKITVSRYRLTDVECKLVFYLIKQMQADGGGHDDYRYTVGELLPVTGLTEFSSASLFQIMIDLFHKIIQVSEVDGWTKYHWFDILKYDANDDVFVVRFNSELKPRLLELRKNFTLSGFKDMNVRGAFPWTGAAA
jgi:hypothetical protein